jgi:adenylosuccinate lyase
MLRTKSSKQQKGSLLMPNYPISALDGRYAKQVASLAPIMSEFGLMRFRLRVMSEWVIYLTHANIATHGVSVDVILQDAIRNFDDASYGKIKEIEATTNHDVKAVEHFMRTLLPEAVWPWIHFACTSEDVNNVAYALMLREAGKICDAELDAFIQSLSEMASQWRSIPMLSRTHGQPATPTTVGKEFAVFVYRVKLLQEGMQTVKITAKWNGATGNFAAHHAVSPEIDWVNESKEFIETFGFRWNPLTTQIESHDTMATILNGMGQICTVMVDLTNDFWGYISNDYFGLKVVKTETGSSTMPGKVNPIDFENARGNFKMARGVGRLLSEELPISMWQRDLTDSTLQRNLGSVFGYYLVALKSLKRGLSKLEIREDVLRADLERHPEVLGEAIQTMLRKHCNENAYELLKDLLRGNKVSAEDLRLFILKLEIPQEDKMRLLELTPATYVGLSAELLQYISEK